MLVRYSVENFLSFKEKNVFELIAGQAEVHSEHLVEDKNSKLKILKSGVIYGANASGKSNFVKSVSFARKIIRRGLQKIDTMNKHFRLDEEMKKKPSVFQFEIKIGDNYYDYGFAIEFYGKKIVEEWLYEKKKTKDNCIFHRENNDMKHLLNLKNKSDKEKIKVYEKDFNESVLTLKEFSSKNWDGEELAVFSKVYNWFFEELIIIFPDDDSELGVFIEQYRDLEHYLVDFDTGIESVVSEPKDYKEWIKEYPEEIRIELQNHLIKFREFEFKKKKKSNAEKCAQGLININGSLHKIKLYKDKETVEKIGFRHIKESSDMFEIGDESDGTKRLIELIPLFDKLSSSESKTLIIDEVDRSFHPALTKKFFEIFFKNSKQNENQLIVTTHDTNLLDLNFLRRDEIWFVDRQEDKSSKIYSLDQFKVRNDKKIDKSYFLGRYGGLPCFGDFEFSGSDIDVTTK